MNIKDTLQNIVSEYKGEQVKLDDSVTFDDLGFDSLDKVDLMMQIEEAFDISFSEDTVINNVGELVGKITELKK